MPTYAERCFSVEEAAKLAGLRRGTLDVMIHRLKDGAECLFAGKRGGRRWFSTKDIMVLAIARELERGGMMLLAAAWFAGLHADGPARDMLADLADYLPKVRRYTYTGDLV